MAYDFVRLVKSDEVIPRTASPKGAWRDEGSFRVEVPRCYARFILEDYGEKFDDTGKERLQTLMLIPQQMEKASTIS